MPAAGRCRGTASAPHRAEALDHLVEQAIERLDPVGAGEGRDLAVMRLRACEIQLAATSMGPVIGIPEEIRKKRTADSLQFDPRFGAGRDVFDALTRMIVREDTSYRE